jgi:hypothetical protein
MFKPLELLNVNGETEVINLSQIVKSFDEVTDDGETLTVIEFTDGGNTVIKDAERIRYLAVENVHKELVKSEVYAVAEQIDRAVKAAPQPPTAPAESPA